jgi:uncharacterized membrane protein
VTLFLLLHGYYGGGAFMGTNTAALAIKKVGYEIAFFILVYTALGAKYLAYAAFNTSVEIIDGPL